MSAGAKASERLRILIVHDSLSENGGVRQMLDLADRLARLGAGPEVYSLQPVREGREATVPPSVPVTRGVPSGGRLRRSGPGAAARLVGACRRADAVVSGSEVGLGLLGGYVAARAARRPFAVVVHAPFDAVLEHWVPPRLQRMTRRVHRRVDAAICVSPALVAGVTANGLDPRRVHVVPNAVDVERVRRQAAADKLPEPRVPVVVGLGRLSPEKGFDLLIRAHAELRRAGVDHELEVIGGGPEREALARLAAECGVADSVSLPGYVENALSHLTRACVVALPSRHEGLPLVLLEALALEVPVIAARSAGAAELLSADQLVDDESVSDLAAALRRHIEEPEPIRAATRAAAAAVRDRTPDDVAREYLAILESTARRPRSQRSPKAAYE